MKTDVTFTHRISASTRKEMAEELAKEIPEATLTWHNGNQSVSIECSEESTEWATDLIFYGFADADADIAETEYE